MYVFHCMYFCVNFCRRWVGPWKLSRQISFWLLDPDWNCNQALISWPIMSPDGWILMGVDILSVNTCLSLKYDFGYVNGWISGFSFVVPGSNFVASVFLLTLICSICYSNDGGFRNMLLVWCYGNSGNFCRFSFRGERNQFTSN